MLSVYDVVRGCLRRVATTHAHGSFGLNLSPDSKLLAFTQPTEVGEDEAVLAADLWVASTSNWLPCRVRTTKEEIESQPEWLSDAALLIKAIRGPPARRWSRNRARTPPLASSTPASGHIASEGLMFDHLAIAARMSARPACAHHDWIGEVMPRAVQGRSQSSIVGSTLATETLTRGPRDRRPWKAQRGRHHVPYVRDLAPSLAFWVWL